MLAAPGLPEADRLLDDHRIAAYAMDAATHGDMAAQPWIENPALVIGPADVIVDRDFRESVLAGRPDWKNQPLQSFFDAQVTHSLDHDACDSLASPCRRTGTGDAAQYVGQLGRASCRERVCKYVWMSRCADKFK